MKTRTLALVLGAGLGCAMGMGSGCVSTLDGKHQAGLPLVSDTIERRYERPLEQVFKAARDTLAYNGVLSVENVVGKTLEAKVDGRSVWASVEAVNPNLTILRIQVRTAGGAGDKELASQMAEQTAVRLATGNALPVSPPTKSAPSAPAK